MSSNEFLNIYKNLFPLMKRHLDMVTLRHWDKKISSSKNILNKSGMKFYSQNDEDGILMEILKRINIKKGNFFEIGVCGGIRNNGTECNTIILLMLGWNGVWVDGVNIDLNLPENGKLNFIKEFINKENCIETFNNALKKSQIKKSEVNVASVDIDGNDFYITEAMLNDGFKPDCFIVEYNGKFPPPIIYNMPYEENYVWKGGDEQGCSLQFYSDFFQKHDYNLVCCNITGTNAFFVDKKHMDKFKDIPNNINEIFYPPDYNWFTQIGHTTSAKTIEYFARRNNQKEKK